MRSLDPPAVETRKHLLNDLQKSRHVMAAFLFSQDNFEKIGTFSVGLVLFVELKRK